MCGTIYISVPLSYILNLTFATGKIPDDLKVAIVTPVYKASEELILTTDLSQSFRVFLKYLKSLWIKDLLTIYIKIEY